MDLSKEEVFTLINAYRKQRLLWDTNHKGYFNKHTKIQAWQTVADAVGVDLENAKRKMASLLGSFRRERAKGKKANQNDPTNTQYKSDWFAFKAFSFLLDPALNAPPINSEQMQLENSNNFEEKPEYEENISFEPQYEEYTEDSVSHDLTGSEIQESIADAFPMPTMIRKRSRSSNHDGITLEYQSKRACRQRQAKVANESAKRDANSKFVKYLEAKLNLFNPTASAILIHKINQLIFEAEMSSISQPHSYSMASASPKSNWTPSPPHINPLVQIEVSRYNEDEEDKKEGIIITS